MVFISVNTHDLIMVSCHYTKYPTAATNWNGQASDTNKFSLTDIKWWHTDWLSTYLVINRMLIHGRRGEQKGGNRTVH